MLLYFELARDKEHVIEPWAELNAIEVDYHLLTAFSIFNFAYSFQFMIFPAYAELENATNARFEMASAISTLVYTVTLISTGVVSVLLFGSELKPDLLDNVAMRKNGVSIFLRVIYCFILLFHLPYIFFAVKEYTMVMYDEFMFGSMSRRLQDKQDADAKIGGATENHQSGDGLLGNADQEAEK